MIFHHARHGFRSKHGHAPTLRPDVGVQVVEPKRKDAAPPTSPGLAASHLESRGFI